MSTTLYPHFSGTARFESNSHLSCFGTCSEFVTFLRFESMINFSDWNIQSCYKHYNWVLFKRIEIKLELLIKNSPVIIDKFGKFLSIFCVYKYFQIHFFMCHTNYKNIPKTIWIIHTKSWYSIIINMCFDLNCCLFLNFLNIWV